MVPSIPFGPLWRLGTRLSLLDSCHPPVLGSGLPRLLPCQWPPLASLSLPVLSSHPTFPRGHFHDIFFPRKSTIAHVAVNDGQAWGLRRDETTGQQ